MAINPMVPMQNLGTGDERANALLMFSGKVEAVLPMATKLWERMAKMTITQGKSFQFPFIGSKGYIEHTAGAEIEGDADPISEERTVAVDDKEIISPVWFTKPAMDIAHYDPVPEAARQCGLAIGRALDSRGFRMIAKGARKSERGGGEFSAGNLVRRNAASVAAAYPVSATGSRNFQDDLASAGQTLREKNVGEDGWVCYITPYLHRVLTRDNVIVNRDYIDPLTNQKLSQVISRVENFEIVVTNNLPSTNVTTGESAYQGNFSYTAALCTAGPDALGCVQFGGVNTDGPTWKDTKRSYFANAAWFGGMKWLKPEYCVEIYANTSAYTLTGTDYAP